MKALLLLLFVLVVSFASAGDTVAVSKNKDLTTISTAVADNPPPVAKSEGGGRFMTNYEWELSIGVLVFGFLILVIEVYLVRIAKISSSNVIKFIIVTLIITGTLFLITAGYSSNEISPALGLLGTIAGYLLGKADNQPVKPDEMEDQKQ